MAHELDIRNGKAAMAFIGETPWHGLGQELDADAGVDAWRVAAGMDWKIRRSRVRFGEGDNIGIMESKHVLFRSDTKDALSIVGKDYKIVQPSQVLEFFRDMVEDSGFTLNTAGVLFGGRKFWALAKIGENAVITGQDEVGGYVLLATSCDGTMPTTARFTTVRVVCNNTLSMAQAVKDRNVVKVSHASTFDPAAVKDRLGIARGQFAAFLNASRALAKSKIDDEGAEQFLTELIVAQGVTNRKGDAEEAARNSAPFKRIMGLFQGSAMGGTLASAEGTKWGLVNAVTEYIDHHSRAASQSNRLENAWFGAGDELKTAAFEKALSTI